MMTEKTFWKLKEKRQQRSRKQGEKRLKEGWHYFPETDESQSRREAEMSNPMDQKQLQKLREFNAALSVVPNSIPVLLDQLSDRAVTAEIAFSATMAILSHSVYTYISSFSFYSFAVKTMFFRRNG